MISYSLPKGLLNTLLKRLQSLTLLLARLIRMNPEIICGEINKNSGFGLRNPILFKVIIENY